MITNGFELWKALVQSGLQESRKNGLSGYDDEIVTSMALRLYPGKKIKNLGRELEKSPPSTELFLEEFFQCLKPFSLMLKDILSMFKAAGARRSEDNLKISFNFDKAGTEISMTLKEFRDCERFTRRVMRPGAVRLWESKYLFDLNNEVRKIIEACINKTILDENISIKERMILSWLDVSRKEFVHFPGFPRTGDKVLDGNLIMAEELVNRLISDAQKIGKTYRDFERGISSIAWDDADFTETDDILPRRKFVTAAHDFWHISFVENLCKAIEVINEPRVVERAAIASLVSQAIKNGFDRVPVETRSQESMEDEFREFVNLPIWKKRHELYAVWVGSRVAESLNEMEWKWLPDGDTLRFPFSGAELATLRYSDGEHVFWTEKRTDLKGKGVFGRRRIQPDYRIMTLPTHRSNSTTLVVECKQYRRWSRKNFSAALDDYALGCPDAQVVLVNYGPVDAAIIKSVDSSRRDRTYLIGDFKPGNDAAFREFRNITRKQYIQKICDTCDGAKIELRWGQCFLDLDLHLVFHPDYHGSALHAGFGNILGYQDGIPHANWPKDVRQSKDSPEEIEVQRWLDGTYDVVVHDFSEGGRFPHGDVSVQMTLVPNGESKMITPKAGVGSFWHVCRIRGPHGRMEEINQVSDTFPELSDPLFTASP